MVRNIQRLKSAFSVRPESLQDTDGAWITRTLVIEAFSSVGRSGLLRFWMSIQTFGMAFHSAVSRGIGLATKAEEWIRASGDT